MRYLLPLILVLVGNGCQSTPHSTEPSPFQSAAHKLLDEHADEGPAWHPDRGLLFSGDGDINRLTQDGRAATFRPEAGSNGLLFDSKGRLVVCERVRRRITRQELDGSLTILTDEFEGQPYNQPNDVTIDSRGRLYFSDPRYGSRDDMRLLDEQGKPIEGVYRIDPDGRVSRIITHEVDRPNGLLVTPDDRFLYVADNNNQAGGPRKLWRFDLDAAGTINQATQTLIYDWETGRGPDGMALDETGRLYVAGGRNEPRLPDETAAPFLGGIYVFSPQGKLEEFVHIPHDEVTNCTFGGKDLRDLYITAGGTLWTIRTANRGVTPWSH